MRSQLCSHDCLEHTLNCPNEVAGTAAGGGNKCRALHNRWACSYSRNCWWHALDPACPSTIKFGAGCCCRPFLCHCRAWAAAPLGHGNQVQDCPD